MEKDIKETRTITEKVKVGRIVVCDCCGKKILEHHIDSKEKTSASYYRVRTGHYDWGNDSCDSIEYKDYCSVDCLQKAFDKYYKETEDGQIGSAYFEISHERY